MAKQPKSAAVAAYRREIAIYLRAVRLKTRWKNVEMGQRAGSVAHTTIGRALKEETTLSFPVLLALEEASGVAIPQTLRGAAIAAQQPTRTEADDLQERISQVARELTRDEQEALLVRLQKELARAS